jgi:hypothetical protein
MPRGPFSKERIQLINGLRSYGGTISAEPGKKLGPEDVKSILGLKSSAVTSLLHRAQVDGIITREVNGRRTLSITLIEGDHLPAPVKKRGPKPRQAGEPKRTYTRRAKVTLPQIGESVTVSMISQNREGGFQLGLRSETSSWMVTVDGFAAVEPIE